MFKLIGKKISTFYAEYYCLSKPVNFMSVHEVSVLIAHAQMPVINIHDVVYSNKNNN